MARTTVTDLVDSVVHVGGNPQQFTAMHILIGLEWSVQSLARVNQD